MRIILLSPADVTRFWRAGHDENVLCFETCQFSGVMSLRVLAVNRLNRYAALVQRSLFASCDRKGKQVYTTGMRA